MDGLLRINAWLSGVVWGWPMLLLLIAAGVLFSVRTRFVQVRRFGEMLRLSLGALAGRKAAKPGEVTPALCRCGALGKCCAAFADGARPPAGAAGPVRTVWRGLALHGRRLRGKGGRGA